MEATPDYTNVSSFTRSAGLIVALSQVWIFALTMAGFIGLLYVLLLGGAKLDETSEKLAYTMLGVLGTIVTGMTNYLFSRQRPSEPTPGETTITPQTIKVTPNGEAKVDVPPGDPVVELKKVSKTKPKRAGV